jgi:hypothetical protein
LDPALREAHYALEQEPARAWEAFNLFRHFYPNVGDLEPLLPRQEGAYLDVIWGLGREGETEAALKVWDWLVELDKEMPRQGLPTGRYQLTQVTLFDFVDQLVSKGLITEAERVWEEALTVMRIPLRHDPPESLLWNGGFETDYTGGLSWRIDAPPGSVAGFSKRIRHSGERSLEIKFDGKHNLEFHGACQSVVVNPKAAYEFSAWLRTDNITTDKGVFFRLRTPQNNEREIVTQELTGTHPWTQLSVRWEAPKGGRLLQICLMRAPSHNLYSAIAGTVWLDDVQLVPIKAGRVSF